MIIQFKKNKQWGLKLKYFANSESLWLGNFLIDGGSLWTDHYREWAASKTFVYSEANDTYLEKENGYVYICDLFIDDSRSGPCYEITIADFIDLLDQWEKALATKPDVITITKENNKLIIKTEHAQSHS